jgi:hypothetical protein
MSRVHAISVVGIACLCAVMAWFWLGNGANSVGIPVQDAQSVVPGSEQDQLSTGRTGMVVDPERSEPARSGQATTNGSIPSSAVRIADRTYSTQEMLEFPTYSTLIEVLHRQPRSQSDPTEELELFEYADYTCKNGERLLQDAARGDFYAPVSVRGFTAHLSVVKVYVEGFCRSHPTLVKVPDDLRSPESGQRMIKQSAAEFASYAVHSPANERRLAKRLVANHLPARGRSIAMSVMERFRHAGPEGRRFPYIPWQTPRHSYLSHEFNLPWKDAFGLAAEMLACEKTRACQAGMPYTMWQCMPTFSCRHGQGLLELRRKFISPDGWQAAERMAQHWRKLANE